MKRWPQYALLTGLTLCGSNALLADNAPVAMPTTLATVPPPASVDPCATPTDPCPPACAESKPHCGPRTIKVIVPPPIVTFRKTGTQVIEAAHCPTKPCAPAPAPCRPAPAGPQMMTVMGPYTYYVQVPTYGVVSTPGFGAAASFGAAVNPVSFGAATAGVGTVPVSFGALPATPTTPAFGAAPATTAQQQQPAAANYGSSPTDSDCKKQLGEISQRVDKLQGELNELKKFTTANQAETELIHGETVKALQRHQDQLNALRKIASDKSLLTEDKPADRLKKLQKIEKEIEEARIKKESEGK